MTNFTWAHKDEIDIQATIDWSSPITHDMLHSGLSDYDETAHFYAIIALDNKEWWCYYIGKVYKQTVSQRHKNKDHKIKLEQLKKAFPNKTWHLTLGKLSGDFQINEKNIDEIESLLIYSHWHEENINQKKINRFLSSRSIQINNEGFSEPFYPSVAYGVMLENV
ncbi:hypothetical protein [Hydrogenovibrio marinus]|uniref:GIY-YIG domain-containing protein n=1 Tax=Hydrogenovibrio marinus TaxID=28885 RepID=A0A066ZSW0_HYDMR|nr:hypothetical protein [Hydrogenovibrio marinus]KDN96577.1 hypothetical protein EI16_09995 [Hydrogenovibrio marinus]BBN60215.1 hypothetical protein HVMH_1809 [Hydrogenovibrio marinus]